MSLAPIETKAYLLGIDSMRPIYLLQRPFDSPAAQEKGVLQLHRRKGGIGASHEECPAPVGNIQSNHKIQKLVDSASLGRPRVVPMNCAVPVSPSSVRPLPEPFSEDTGVGPAPGRGSHPGQTSGRVASSPSAGLAMDPARRTQQNSWEQRSRLRPRNGRLGEL